MSHTSNLEFCVKKSNDTIRRPDSYHSCYALAGLSSAQNRYVYSSTDLDNEITPLPDAFRWAVTAANAEMDESDLIREEDRVSLIHPIFVLPWGAAERTRLQFQVEASFQHKMAKLAI